MFGSLTGKITKKLDKLIIVEVGGVGYKVSVLQETLDEKNEDSEIKLWVHTHVREDAIDLYGFMDFEDLESFEMLISVSGIGPKGALTILGIAGRNALHKAITSNDVSYLTKLSGIGKKTAEKIILELRDKIKNTDDGGNLAEDLDALEALKALGFKEVNAREALKKTKGANVNMRIKEALKILK